MQEGALKQFLPTTESWFRKIPGEPTEIWRGVWPAIADGKHVLVSAPTGIGKTLSTFLVLVDRSGELTERGELREEPCVVYVSPLKSLAGDIRENLRGPLERIGARAPGESKAESRPGNPSIGQIQTVIRAGDMLQKERQRMIKHPSHILIITPESPYLMLTSKSDRQVLEIAEVIILDEIHALINAERGAYLILSVAGLDKLCGRRLQRIGLSAIIEPLELAVAYLSPELVAICAPPMDKQVDI